MCYIIEEVCKELVLSELGTVSLVCERCSKEEPPHIMLEGARLLAAIIKYCKSEGELTYLLCYF